jgi:hypothetical protein
MKSVKRVIVVFLFVLPMIVTSAALNAGKGAAIGAVVGTTAAAATKGAKVTVPSETLPEFRLQQPASLPFRT